MKLAISIPDPLFERVALFSTKHFSSRSEVFARAVEAYINFQESQDSLLKQLNKAYKKPSPETVTIQKVIQKKFASQIESDPY